MTNRILLACFLGTIGLGATACGSSPPPAQPAPQPMVVVSDHYSGHWEGAATVSSPLEGAPENMDIVAVLVEGGGQCGTIEYSHAGCSGAWTCNSSDYNADVLNISENIRFGGERCPDGAQVELRRTNDPNVLEFRYSHPGVQAVGQINRRRIQ